MKRYLIRLDDACPTMPRDKWHRMEELLCRYGIRPMVGVIPNNADPDQLISSEDSTFWDKVKDWENKGWAIAMHGYDHKLESECGGMNPIWKKSEFAGLPLQEQMLKMRRGIDVFRKNGVEPRYFFAPCHTFDRNTLRALREETPIRVISDTIALRPYRKDGFVFIPQIGGVCREMKFPGIFTFCFHPSTMKPEDFERLETFLKTHGDDFIAFSDIDLTHVGRRGLADRILNFAYFSYRRLRGRR